MNATSSTSVLLPSRPGTDPVFGQLGGVFRTTLRSLRLQWFLYRVERRKVQPVESLCDMNAHLLRDIGAPDDLMLRAAATRPAYQRHGIPFGLSVMFIALGFTLAGVGTPTSAGTLALATASGKPQAQVQPASVPMAGVFAGEYQNGAPVYRFPAVVVTGSRKDSPPAHQPPCRQTLAQTVKGRA